MTTTYKLPYFSFGSAAVALAAALLAGCGGGGSETLALTPDREIKQINTDTMLNAAAIGYIAHLHAYQDTAQLLRERVLELYKTQLVSGKYACAKSGSLSLERSGDIWRYAAQDCDMINVQIQSGQWEIDASQAASAGVKVKLINVLYPKAFVDTPNIVVNGAFTFDIPGSPTPSSQGTLTYSYSNTVREYGDIRLTQRQGSSGSYDQRSITIVKSPVTSLLLTATANAANELRVTAADGSSVSLPLNTSNAADYTLSLRNSASGPVLLSKTVPDRDMRVARIAARL